MENRGNMLYMQLNNPSGQSGQAKVWDGGGSGKCRMRKNEQRVKDMH